MTGVLELVAMAAWLCECTKNRALHTLKGCICWCGSDISIRPLFKLPLPLDAGLTPAPGPRVPVATAANAREVALPVLRAAPNSVRVSLCFCLNICTNCRVRSPSGPTLGQYS